jgi:hypothetical protein
MPEFQFGAHLQEEENIYRADFAQIEKWTTESISPNQISSLGIPTAQLFEAVNQFLQTRYDKPIERYKKEEGLRNVVIYPTKVPDMYLEETSTRNKDGIYFLTARKVLKFGEQANKDYQKDLQSRQ